jgi:hypothetical protein
MQFIKMTAIKVLSLQSFLDLSIQYTGNVYNAFEIALANNKSVTDSLTVGETLIIPNGLTKSNKELQYFAARNLLPATAMTTPKRNIDYSFPQGEFPFSF